VTVISASLNGRGQIGPVTEPDPGARARRRTFTAEYKAGILAEYDALAASGGERGALLRREGLYSSHITEWRRARDNAAKAALAPNTRTSKRSKEAVELERLRRRNAQLEAELARSKKVSEIMGKAHALLQAISESADSENKPTT
jgi:transposase